MLVHTVLPARVLDMQESLRLHSAETPVAQPIPAIPYTYSRARSCSGHHSFGIPEPEESH
jgi:hypothetical protein